MRFCSKIYLLIESNHVLFEKEREKLTAITRMKEKKQEVNSRLAKKQEQTD